MTTTESELERQVREEDEAHHAEEVAERRDRVEGTTEDEDAEKGKLFDVPRVGILTDDSDPSALALAFSGSVKLERGQQSDADLYNALKAGKSAELRVTVHVGTTSKVHRRDKEGDVDAIVETKSLIVHSIELDE